MRKPRSDINTVEKLFSKYVIIEDSCWVWVGASYPSGYGKAQFNHKTALPHRVFYERQNGKIPSGLEIDHLCRYRKCVNPEHLEAVTRAVNTARSLNPTALNGRKTECIRGHSLSGENLFFTPDGRRQCRTCQRMRNSKKSKNQNERLRLARSGGVSSLQYRT